MSDPQGGAPRRPQKKPGNLHDRFKEAWTWYREDLRTSGLKAGSPQEQSDRVNGAMVVFALLLVGVAVFRGAPGPLVMIFAMGAVIVFTRARKGRDEEARQRYGRLENFAEAVFLFFLFILIAGDVLPQLF